MINGHLLNIFNDVDRLIYGFDTFEGFIEESLVNEGYQPSKEVLEAYKAGTSMEFVQYLAKLNKYPYIEFVKGDIATTGPEFVKRHTGFKIALLYMDVDFYDPTRAALQTFIPVMQPGGIIAFDQYNIAQQHGETRAADEILAEYGLQVMRDPSPITPTAYCRIPNDFDSKSKQASESASSKDQGDSR